MWQKQEEERLAKQAEVTKVEADKPARYVSCTCNGKQILPTSQGPA